MELYLQSGWNMMKACRTLLEEWGDGTVILSPRDLDPMQLSDGARQVLDRGGTVLLDPQLYTPHEKNFRLSKHSFWPGCSGVCDVSAPEWRKSLRALGEVNTSLGTDRIVLPGVICSKPEDVAGWRTQLSRVVDAAVATNLQPETCLLTVAVGHESLSDADTVHAILDALEGMPHQGFYIVLEYPPGPYFVRDPRWLSNALDLAAGCALKRGQVIVGYCGQQMLPLAAAGVGVIASGTFQNLRQFGLKRFRNPVKETKQTAKWYYSPPALSEYRVTYLDIAAQRGVLQKLRPQPGFPITSGERLFSAPSPSSAAFSFPDSYEHFLSSLRHQAAKATLSTFAETVAHLEDGFEAAVRIADEVSYAGVKGEHKQFDASACSAATAALAALRADRMPMLSRAWPTLPAVRGS